MNSSTSSCSRDLYRWWDKNETKGFIDRSSVGEEKEGRGHRSPTLRSEPPQPIGAPDRPEERPAAEAWRCLGHPWLGSPVMRKHETSFCSHRNAWRAWDPFYSCHGMVFPVLWEHGKIMHPFGPYTIFFHPFRNQQLTDPAFCVVDAVASGGSHSAALSYGSADGDAGRCRKPRSHERRVEFESTDNCVRRFDLFHPFKPVRFSANL